MARSCRWHSCPGTAGTLRLLKLSQQQRLLKEAGATWKHAAWLTVLAIKVKRPVFLTLSLVSAHSFANLARHKEVVNL